MHFKLQAADVEQNNVKGDKRFFVPRVKEIDWNEEAGELVIPFEYRPLTEQEEIAYGKKNQQDAIIAEAVEAIPEQLRRRRTARWRPDGRAPQGQRRRSLSPSWNITCASTPSGTRPTSSSTRT